MPSDPEPAKLHHRIMLGPWAFTWESRQRIFCELLSVNPPALLFRTTGEIHEHPVRTAGTRPKLMRRTAQRDASANTRVAERAGSSRPRLSRFPRPANRGTLIGAMQAALNRQGGSLVNANGEVPSEKGPPKPQRNKKKTQCLGRP